VTTAAASALDSSFGITKPQSGQLLTAGTDLIRNALIEKPITAIAAQKADVHKPRPRRLVHDYVRPALGLDNLASPGTQQHDSRLLHPLGSDNINDHRPAIGFPQVIRNMPTWLPANVGPQHKGLRHNLTDSWIEVSQQQVRQLQPRLVNNVVALRGRPVGPRVMALAKVPAEPAPWSTCEQRCRGHLSSRCRPLFTLHRSIGNDRGI
jgi:hypothetical protein